MRWNRQPFGGRYYDPGYSRRPRRRVTRRPLRPPGYGYYPPPPPPPYPFDDYPPPPPPPRTWRRW